MGLGANLGDRKSSIEFALERLRLLSEGERIDVSPIYETAPWGPVKQSPFLNCVVRIWATLEPLILHSKFLEIERSAGRLLTRKRWGPRELDVDILIYGKRIIRTLALSIPHPRLSERRFVLIPLNDIAPNEIIPGRDLTVRQALDECPDDGWVKVINLP